MDTKIDDIATVKNIAATMMDHIDKITEENNKLKKKNEALLEYIQDLNAACVALGIELPVLKKYSDK